MALQPSTPAVVLLTTKDVIQELKLLLEKIQHGIDQEVRDAAGLAQALLTHLHTLKVEAVAAVAFAARLVRAPKAKARAKA
jgi:hypothetical protein